MATTTPDASLKTREEVLDSVVSLARLFSTTVEAFGKIHPRELNHNQQIALTCLGIEQGRLLIWGNAVGISSPPATIAKHMIPSRPGDFNPDPTAPVNFIPRDPRLDDPDVRTTVETCLRDLVDRPAHLPRVEMMRAFGLKQPRPNSQTAAPKTLDHNRLEGFREQFSILCDLVDEPASERRRMSIIMDDWIIHNAQQFSTFVQFAREHVDTLIALMDVQAQVDKVRSSDATRRSST
ncbi:hypothetical protein P152DRAFT_47272 [Eremomyces bilateralis CBS 781.70]|uniref:Prion-inhibition and propagation HeLo domain-containing protein n=1 Tax=Eremomyces bilateralis CBS 781.70 TaxID=1392243 RepID=A0A6G1G2I0_9PEZI|nr:uncharacterized protein P152DRAFT_47272 [Eremomyces bilateralis CBS 781.70]KAF1812131.1 hypothetical protein P152DRAFT_47272 [Eremomyces bilateralis CBS 781.70]